MSFLVVKILFICNDIIGIVLNCSNKREQNQNKNKNKPSKGKSKAWLLISRMDSLDSNGIEFKEEDSKVGSVTMCAVCSRGFSLDECRARKQTQCLQCDETFGPNCVLDRHVESVQCKRLVLNMPLLKVSADIVKHESQEFDLSFESKDVLNEHSNKESLIELETQQAQTKLGRKANPKCSHCGKRFKSSKFLDRHIQRLHSGSVTKCHQCQELNSFKQNLLLQIENLSWQCGADNCDENSNLQTTNKAIKLSCLDCQEKFHGFLSHIEETHIKPKLDKKDFEAPMVDAMENGEVSDNSDFGMDRENLPEDNSDTEKPLETDPDLAVATLKLDEIVKENQVPVSSIDKPLKIKIKRKVYVKKGRQKMTTYCKMCDKNFTQRCHLTRHMKLVHNDGGGFRCDFCNVDFNSSNEKRIHNRTAHNKRKAFYKCPQCGKILKGKYVLKLHIQTVHDKIKKFKCQHCDRTFANSTGRACHVESIHGGGVRQFKCEANGCSKAFKFKSQLKLHTANVHERVKKYQCHKCEKIFVRPTTLQNHIAVIHDKTAKHQCKYCDLGFTVPYSLTRHIEAVHENKRKHQCDKCGSSYNYATLLEKHMKAVHYVIDDFNQPEPQ